MESKFTFTKADYVHAFMRWRDLEGGLTSEDVRSLAEEMDISEEVLQRYILARRAFVAWWDRTWKLVEKMPTEPGERWTEKFIRNLYEAPENEITREYNEALAAFNAAVDASNPSRWPPII